MKVKWESVATGAIIIAAVAVAAANISVALQRGPGAVRLSGRSGPPEFVAKWQDMLEHGIVIGDTSASVKVVEFADFECPFCRRFHNAYRESKALHGADLALIFIHYPLSTHRFAVPAARASECALAQGRFAEFVDVLFGKQDSLGLKPWSSYAHEAGVADSARFEACIANNEPMPRTEAGLRLGAEIDVRATPTVLINGWRFHAAPYDSLSEIVTRLRLGAGPQGKDASW